jgi:hypothetical protein
LLGTFRQIPPQFKHCLNERFGRKWVPFRYFVRQVHRRDTDRIPD